MLCSQQTRTNHKRRLQLFSGAIGSYTKFEQALTRRQRIVGHWGGGGGGEKGNPGPPETGGEGKMKPERR